MGVYNDVCLWFQCIVSDVGIVCFLFWWAASCIYKAAFVGPAAMAEVQRSAVRAFECQSSGEWLSTAGILAAHAF